MKIECRKVPTIRVKGLGDNSLDRYCHRCNAPCWQDRQLGNPFVDPLCEKCLQDFAVLTIAFKKGYTIDIPEMGD